MTEGNGRDAGMERLLRSALRPPPGVPDTCPGPGLLAAYVEGTLTANEEAALDDHAAACGRCQEALALMAQELPDETVEAPDRVRQSAWFTWATRPRLRWLVPISAVATVAVVIFATRPLIAPEGMVPVGELARADKVLAPPDELREPAKQTAATMADAAPAVERERSQRAAAAAESSPPAAGVPPAPIAPPAPIMVAAQDAAAGAAPRPEAAPQAARTLALRTASEEKAAPPLAAGMPGLKQKGETVIVPAPGGSVRWRAGGGGALARSDDAGGTWRPQASGVTADFAAGAALSPTVCWLVGASGTVLVTADGERWERRTFPLAVDLVGIEAASARAAIVTTRDGRRFETLDGGLSWAPKQP